MEEDEYTLDMALEFHRSIAAIVSAVQEGIWKSGRHELIGYDSDFGFGQKRGIQTLVLKTPQRSAYVRLDWVTVLSGAPEGRQLVDGAIQGAIGQLS